MLAHSRPFLLTCDDTPMLMPDIFKLRSKEEMTKRKSIKILYIEERYGDLQIAK